LKETFRKVSHAVSIKQPALQKARIVKKKTKKLLVIRRRGEAVTRQLTLSATFTEGCTPCLQQLGFHGERSAVKISGRAALISRCSGGVNQDVSRRHLRL
jgi:hypothetical protein